MTSDLFPDCRHDVSVEVCSTLKTADIERAIMTKLMRQSSIFLPHYTPTEWWECDVFELTRAGFGVEYEVKVSRSDFASDASKSKRQGNKHEFLASHSEYGPSRFYYVIPAGLIRREELPAFSGLIEARWEPAFEHPFRGKRPAWVSLHEIVKAPVLHRVKSDEERLKDIFKTGYYRYRSQLWDKIITKARSHD